MEPCCSQLVIRQKVCLLEKLIGKHCFWCLVQYCGYQSGKCEHLGFLPPVYLNFWLKPLFFSQHLISWPFDCNKNKFLHRWQNVIPKFIVCTPPPLSAGGGGSWASNQIFKKGGLMLDRSSTFRGGCWKREGDFFQGRGCCNFHIKKLIKIWNI